MKAKAYSIADGIAARQIFPDLVEQNGWLEKPWTDDEINTAKRHEMNDFIKSPSLSLMPPPPQMQEDFVIAMAILDQHKDYR